LSFDEKKCFVKEKGKKESFGRMRLSCRQKGNGIKEGCVGWVGVYAVVFLQVFKIRKAA
jgi:hypothetical protein